MSANIHTDTSQGESAADAEGAFLVPGLLHTPLETHGTGREAGGQADHPEHRCHARSSPGARDLAATCTPPPTHTFPPAWGCIPSVVPPHMPGSRMSPAHKAPSTEQRPGCRATPVTSPEPLQKTLAPVTSHR